MTTASKANLELAIVLPLGVLARQLMKVETDFRSLGMRASAYAGSDSATSREVAGHLETINDALDSIRGLLANFQSDFQPSPGAARRGPNADRDD